MTIKNIVFTLLATIAVCESLAFGQLTPGNLVVLRAGDGSAALSGAGTATFLDQYNLTGTLQTPSATVNISTTGGTRLVMSGSAITEGYITRSSDGTRIVVSGYDAAVGTASVNGTNSSVVSRVVNAVDLAGTNTRLGTTNTFFSSNNIRSAYSSGTSTWAAGGTSGTVLFPNTQINTDISNQRVVNGFNGNLYFSTAQGVGTPGSTVAGIYKYNGMPTSSSTPTQLFNTGVGTLTTANQSSLYAFAVNPSETVVYVADDRSTANGGGIQKWTFDGSTWSLAGTFNNLSVTTGARGLAVDFSGSNPILYATTGGTSANRLVSIVDLGTNFGDAAIVLAIANTNTVFRGVTFTPVPEPGTVLAFGAVALGAGAFVRRKCGKKVVAADVPVEA